MLDSATLGVVAFAVTSGVGTFFAPCAYPLLPGYVGYYLGEEDASLSGAVGRGVAAGVGALFALGAIAGVVVSVGQRLVANVVYLEPVIGLLLVVLDLLPQSVVQPYFSGRQFDTLMLLFAYILGPMLFGWYGFFLLPILTVLAVEAVRIVLPQLLHGESLGAQPSVAEGVGADPEELRDDEVEESGGESAGESSSGSEGSGSGSGSSQSPG